MNTHGAPLMPEKADASPAPTVAADKRKFKPLHIALAAVLSLVVLGGGFVAVAKATDSPTFCGSACHEMGPYHTAWSTGAHKNIACVECHVDPGPVAQLEHKFVALRQLIDHVKGAPAFPLVNAPDVPDSRCERCHANVTVAVTGFSHADHAKRGPCIKCHADAGHNVTQTALQQAGILNVAYRHTVEPTASATPGGGKADIANHISVACSNCHDMAAMKCVDCHTAPDTKHQNRSADCTICHAPGPKFVFTHPQETDCASCHDRPTGLTPPHPTTGDCTTCHLSGPGVDWKFTHPQIDSCGDCHTPPTNLNPPHSTSKDCTMCHRAGPGRSFAFTHPDRSDCETCHDRPSGGNPPHPQTGSCTTCHHNRGVNWNFSHPSSSANCTSCHTPPAATHANRTDCTQCHVTGVSWKFNHPGRGADCSNCHARPSGGKPPHPTSGTCATCHHNPGQNWKFTHPSPGASCADCHNRPSNHSSGACQNCHRNAGRSWAFSHPSTTNCSSCHTPPSNHYGNNCGSCHVAGTTWQNVHFNHPKTPAPHGVAGKACSACHPNGPPAYFCTCHGNTTGPTD